MSGAPVFTLRCHLCAEPIRHAGAAHDCAHGLDCRERIVGTRRTAEPDCPLCRHALRKQLKLPGITQ